VTVAGRKTSHRAKAAWRKRDIATKECTRDNVASRTQRGQTLERPIIQQWHKAPRPKTATMWQQVDRRPMWQTAATFWKQEGIQRDLLEGHRAGDREASCRDFQQVEKNQKLDHVEGWDPF
jgi:hypothetical protein